MSDLVGLMDKTVVFKTNSPTTLGAGNKDVYSTSVTTRGYLKKDGGSRGLSFGDITGNNTWTLTVRKQAALTAILSMSLKVTIDSKTFTVQGYENVNEDGFYYRFSLTQSDA